MALSSPVVTAYSGNEHADLGGLEKRQEARDRLGDSLAGMLDIWVHDYWNMAPERSV